MTCTRFLAIALTLASLPAAGCGGGSDRSTGDAGSSTAPAGAQTDGTSAPRGATDTPALVKRLAPAVVAIRVQSAQGAGEGSGVVWDDEGRIVTNNHVVEGTRAVVVQTMGGDRLPARVVASDPRTDLAVVKLDRGGGDLPPAAFADTLPEVGSLALALGSPLGFENTVTAGIVSGLDRSLPTAGDEPSLVGLLQTDAAISPGNSGGALVGASGRVIGINVAYLPPQETGAVSIGFAIPAPTVRDIVGQLIENGRVEHPYLGVRLGLATDGTDERVVIVGVEEGGPAADAGARPGDIVTRIADREVRAIEDIYEALRGRRPGTSVTVEVQRGGDRRKLDVRLGQRPEPAPGVLPGG
jgi:S1-C subfamily serine protease